MAQPKAELRRTASNPFFSLGLEEPNWGEHLPRPGHLRGGSGGVGTGLPYGPSAHTLTTQLLLEHQITDYEERLKAAMGPMALYGLRYCTLVGLAAATLVKIGLAISPMTTPLVPLVGMAIFLGLLVGGIVVGAAVQAIARHKFRKNEQERDLFLKELGFYEQQLLRKSWLSGTEVRQLRRLQILRADIHGGFKHSLWSVLHSITGFDPQLRTMMQQAKNDRPLGPQALD